MIFKFLMQLFTSKISIEGGWPNPLQFAARGLHPPLRSHSSTPLGSYEHPYEKFLFTSIDFLWFLIYQFINEAIQTLTSHYCSSHNDLPHINGSFVAVSIICCNSNFKMPRYGQLVMGPAGSGKVFRCIMPKGQFCFAMVC